MRFPFRFDRLVLAALFASAAVAWPLAQAAQAGPPPPTVPSEITVPAGNKVFLVGHAVGVQIYACNATGWSFAGPRANLYDDRGKLIITHSAGPTWEASDGSRVVGGLAKPAPVDPTAIPWLRLTAVSTSAGPDGGERLAHTTYIQRIATTGGLVPAAADCNAATVGTRAEVPYTADYSFWKAWVD